MLSELELRSIIEGSFLPKRCECTKAEDASLTIKVYDDRDRDRVDLEVKGINADKLDSSRAICNLIAGLREDLKHTQTHTLRRAGGRGYF
ncbi:DUF1652 domain-containing protein [Pseudomonas sp. P867]|uniref:DUF1652 domain-containing protein n=1 Tax=Pseudomonas synxantha TaxID=47883 RepID=A0A5D3G2Z4_9PSED|nr:MULTISPECIES: DUF1652 domain-containing protein [Pseudomonas]KFF42524.1 hypothetical protein JH25_01655 [Pseudomonas sp. BRG-100]MBY8973468.1 DUF1652 domain-containing protein [Pseudomonas sp. P867]MCK3827738.1 DUF1652 domain-containing protein [Pseudomonas sp. W2Aug9]MCK3838509.1 DUF1652 domain-containing protein [Pseudomonas sp. NCIMB 10586]MCK3844338.1 DUF1652 domain-containing protein [Pseudomonas sp. W15Feb34]